MNVFLENDIVKITLGEVLQSDEGKELIELVEDNTKKGYFKFVADCKNLRSIGSLGLSAFLRKTRDLTSVGGYLKIINLEKQPLSVIEMTGLNRVLNIVKSKENKDILSTKSELEFSIKHENLNNIDIIHLVGTSYSNKTIEKISDELGNVIHNKCKIILDLEHLKYMDSQTINQILNVNYKVNRQDGSMAICNTKGIIAEMLEMLNIGSVIPIYRSTIECLEKMK